jgi:hypothetical protein
MCGRDKACRGRVRCGGGWSHGGLQGANGRRDEMGVFCWTCVRRHLIDACSITEEE